jgi:integrase
MMEGYVRKQGSRWYVVLEVAPDPVTGHRRRRGGGAFATKAEAKAALHDALEQSKRGWQGPDRVSLAGHLTEWLDGIELSRAPTTAALYRTLLQTHVIPRIGGEKLQRVTPAMLTKLYADLTKQLSAKSVRNVHTTLRKALADAVQQRRLDWNPAEAVEVPKVEATERDVWDASQLGTFLVATTEDRLAALWIVAATTGMRRGELLGLRWSDVDLEAEQPILRVRRAYVQYGALRVEKEPKTPRSRRTIALDAAAVVALRRHSAAQAKERLAAGVTYEGTDRVFADEIGRALSPDGVSKAFSAAVQAADLPRITLHGLRHTFATVGLESGVDTVYLSQILGHPSPAITASIYQHTRDERLAAAVRQVGDAIYGRKAGAN